jgi:hypothetical protein
MKVYKHLLLILLTISFVTACDGDYDSTYPTGTVELENENSSLSIREFNFSPYNQSTWGANQLSSPLLAGLSFDITSVPIGSYDARALVRGLYSSYSTYINDVPVIEGSLTTVVSTDSGYTGSLKVVNGTVDAKIIALYLSPSTSSVWRENQIDSQVVPSGSMHLFDIDTGLYDVRVVWDVGPDSFYYDKSIESLTLLTLTVS